MCSPKKLKFSLQSRQNLSLSLWAVRRHQCLHLWVGKPWSCFEQNAMPADPKHHSGSHDDAEDKGLFSQGGGGGGGWHLLTIADKGRDGSTDADNCWQCWRWWWHRPYLSNREMFSHQWMQWYPTVCDESSKSWSDSWIQISASHTVSCPDSMQAS